MSEVRDGMEFLQAHVFTVDVEVVAQRELFAAILTARAVADGVGVDDVEVAGVPCRRLTPEGAVPGRAFVYAHGGGYCIGTPAMGDALGERLAVALRATWYGVDYRLAPEHRAPGALEDVRAVLGALPGAVAIGDSAGAGALVAALSSGGAAAALVAICPWLDLTATHLDPGEPPLTGAWLERCAAHYAPIDREGPDASPGRHPWRVAAPTLVVGAGLDPLVGDARALVGVPGVEVREWGSALHDFALLAGADPDADEAVGVVLDFVAGATGWMRIDSAVTG